MLCQSGFSAAVVTDNGDKLALLDIEAHPVNGVYYHGLVGDRCAEKYSARAMLPSDMISELKTIFL